MSISDLLETYFASEGDRITDEQQQLLRNYLDSMVGNEYAEDLSRLSSLNLDVEAEDWPGGPMRSIPCTNAPAYAFPLENNETFATPDSHPPCLLLLPDESRGSIEMTVLPLFCCSRRRRGHLSGRIPASG